MRRISSRTPWTIALAATGTVAIASAGISAASWRWSDDELRPVISVRRIVVLRLDPDFGD